MDVDGLFISGPAVVEVLHDDWPIDRCFGFFLMRVMVLLPKPEVAEDPFYELGVIDEADRFQQLLKLPIPALLRAKSALKNCTIPKSYLQRKASTCPPIS